jgi:hypothetical protein
MIYKKITEVLMKNLLRFVFSLLIISQASVFSQNDWQYTQKLYFPASDTAVVRPYLCTLTEDGKLFVISSRITDTKAHNAIYVLNPGDTIFTKFIDYNENGDSDTLIGNIGALRGITSLGNTLFVTATQPYPKTKPNTVSATYLYPNFDTLQVQKFGFGLQGSGYGSYNHGCDITKDSVLFTGISFGTTFRCYNFSDTITVAGKGSYIPPPQYTVEPGGLERGGLDLIRDVALIPGGNYFDPSTPFYTSRNTHPNPPQSGGIAKWEGGTQRTPVNYIPARVEDTNQFLTLGTAYPVGITVDKDGYLWVAGIDTNRRWVKAFQVDGVFAFAVAELPGQFSKDFPDPAGAPMGSPCDVSISRDGKTAYVIDHWGRSAFMFTNTLVSVEDKYEGVYDFALEQNYPNPFNPTTMITFTLPYSSNVKLVISDILGKEVATLVDENLPAGRHTKLFNADQLSSGIYFYTLVTNNGKLSKKMLLMK